MNEFVSAPARVPVHFVFSAVRATWRLRHAVPRVRPAARVGTAPPRFAVAVDRGARMLRVTGEFDLAAVGRFTAATAGLTAAHPGDVTVDLSGMEFIDAAGMGALVALDNLVTGTGRHLTLRGANARTRRLFAVVGLSGLLPSV